ncbi:MAG TPA: peptidoglycan editing factor PgeF [Solibacterales bacterium]|nr:peptidoglycan editing factor PgeF [Bryobacterales bacterium]
MGMQHSSMLLAEHGYQSPVLLGLDWLFHAFGTRASGLPPWPLATAKQVHSAIVLRAAGAGVQGTADGLISDTEGLLLGMKTADCFPVLIADPQHRAVAAVHAGWRGVAGGIVPAALHAMGQAFGSDAPDLHVAVGPGIGPCCFEVGPEVALQFGQEGRVHLDLGQEIARQLAICGVPETQVDTAHLCTFCDPGAFHSYRREGAAAGRMMSVIGIQAGK